MPRWPERTFAERFWEKVDKDGPAGCWIWTGAIGNKGYGHITVRRPGFRSTLDAHRLAYEFVVGEIPPGLQLDHLCRVRRCVNPAHLDPVTRKENILRGVGPTAVNARKTHCKRGHPFDEENTGRNTGGGRACRACRPLRVTGGQADDA